MEIPEGIVEHEFRDDPTPIKGTLRIHRILAGMPYLDVSQERREVIVATLSCPCANCMDLKCSHDNEPATCSIFARHAGLKMDDYGILDLRGSTNDFTDDHLAKIEMRLVSAGCRPSSEHELYEKRRSQQKRSIKKGKYLAVCVREPLRNWQTGVVIYRVGMDADVIEVTKAFTRKNHKHLPEQTQYGQYLVKATKLEVLRKGTDTSVPMFRPLPVYTNKEMICDNLDGDCDCGKTYHQHLVNLDSVHNIGFDLRRGSMIGPVQGVTMQDVTGIRTVEKYQRLNKLIKEINKK